VNVPILVIDDEPANLFALESLLDMPGVDIVTAASGAAGLHHLIEREFALILLDVNMPGLDGFETAALIRARPASAHTPIIFITAHSDDRARMLKAYETGAADYVLKPFEPVVLRSKVGVFVELFRAAEVKRRAAELELSNRRLETDLADQGRVAAQLAHQASHDNHTGLPNRHLFEEIVREALALSQRGGHHAAVAFVDLDRFKFINDTYGHAAGDEVLKETARRLSGAVRDSDVVARIGGDEFVVLLTEFVQWQESALVAEKIERHPDYSARGIQLQVHGVTLRQYKPSDADYALVANAPVVFARPNTVGKFTDIPLLLYCERLGDGSLRYSMIFSNEDGGTNTQALMARWGRATDIEYIYMRNRSDRGLELVNDDSWWWLKRNSERVFNDAKTAQSRNTEMTLMWNRWRSTLFSWYPNVIVIGPAGSWPFWSVRTIIFYGLSVVLWLSYFYAFFRLSRSSAPPHDHNPDRV